MANFFNKRKADEYYQNMPELQALQLNADGTAQVVDNVPDMQPVRIKDRLANALFGVQSTPTDGVLNLNTGEITGKDAITGEDVTYNPTANTTVSSNPRVGGLLNDLSSGYNENYNNRFRFGNWGNNDLDFDRKKGFGYRLGEGLGTIGRFIDSPLGRGVLAYGLNSALGYNNSLQEGLQAAVGRQNAQTADRVYRQQLRQMGYTDDDLAEITGNITPQIYKGLTDSFRLGNQRITYGQLAMFDDGVAEQVRQNPELANQFIPMTFARDIYGKKRDLAEEKIANDKVKLAQNERRLNILQQKVNQGAATAAELSEYRTLKKKQLELENELYERELGRGGNNTTGGTTKSGVRYKVVE